MKEWIRVTRENPCPVCKKQSWCLIGETLILCMRVSSNRPKTLKSGETGWLHPIGATTSSSARPAVLSAVGNPRPSVNCRALMAGWRAKTPFHKLGELAKSLGVINQSVLSVGFVWADEHRAFACPFWDGLGHMVGIQLRYQSGFKRTLDGTHNGLIIPDMPAQPTVVICEGASDTCAALSMDYYAVGRPSCSGGAPMLKDLIRRTKVTRAIVVADADDPGLNGARSLVSNLQVPACILTLPTKDLRQFHRDGGTRETIESLAKASVWHNRR